MKPVFLAIGVSLACVFVIACALQSSVGGPPIDGTWSLSALNCGSVALQPNAIFTSATAVSLSVFGDAGSFISTFTTSAGLCKVTIPQVINYVTTSSLTLTQGPTTQCSPSNCGGSQCPVVASSPVPGVPSSTPSATPTVVVSYSPTPFNYTVSTSNLSLTSTAVSDPACVYVSASPLSYGFTKQ